MIKNPKIRYGKSFSKLRKIAKKLLSWVYPLVVKIFPLPRVYSVEETLDFLLKNPEKSLVRFGDGEILYLVDQLNLPFQKYEMKLAGSFAEILRNNQENLLVGLPIGYSNIHSLNAEGQEFWKSQISWNYPRFRKYLTLQTWYFNASVTRLFYGFGHTYAAPKFEQWKEIFRAKNALIIEGEKTRFGHGNDLLKNIENIHRILAPKHDAFSKCDQILDYVSASKKNYDLILIALGPAAKYLTLHLSKNGHRVLDVGNLDIEYEWFLSGSSERIKIKGKYTSEVIGGREVEDLDDPSYHAQILTKFLS